MNTIKIISELEKAKGINRKLAANGLKISIDGKFTFCESIDEMIQNIKEIDVKKLYKIDVKVSELMFLSITVTISYLTEREVKYPLNLVKIARNLKAVSDSNYERTNVHSTYKFYSTLKSKLDKIIKKLTSEEVDIINQLIS